MPIPGGTLVLLNRKEKDRNRLSGGQSPRRSPSSLSSRQSNHSPSHGPTVTAPTSSTPSAAGGNTSRHQSPRSPRRSPPSTLHTGHHAGVTETSDYTSCCCYPGLRLSTAATVNDEPLRATQETNPATSLAVNDSSAAGQCNSSYTHRHHHQQQQQQGGISEHNTSVSAECKSSNVPALGPEAVSCAASEKLDG